MLNILDGWYDTVPDSPEYLRRLRPNMRMHASRRFIFNLLTPSPPLQILQAGRVPWHRVASPARVPRWTPHATNLHISVEVDVQVDVQGDGARGKGKWREVELDCWQWIVGMTEISLVFKISTMMTIMSKIVNQSSPYKSSFFFTSAMGIHGRKRRTLY